MVGAIWPAAKAVIAIQPTAGKPLRHGEGFFSLFRLGQRYEATDDRILISLPGARADPRPDSSDDALMRRVAARDALAFSSIVDAHAAMIHRIAYRMIADAAEAEDMAQEALLRLWRSAQSWQPDRAGIAAWLTRVTINLCIDRLRRRRFTSDAEMPDLVDDAAGADVLLDAERARARTIAALDALSDRQRAAIILTYYEELPNILAAEVLEMKIKAFESLLLRARAALRNELTASGIVAADGECAT